MKYKYTDIEFEEAIKTSRSVAEALRKLGLVPKGGNYRRAKILIKKLNIDLSHHVKPGWNKGIPFGPKFDIKDYLDNKRFILSCDLKKRLIKEGYFQEICQDCKLTEWRDNKIPLELHHVDGNKENNNLTNLQLLCPNCHTLTPNYKGRNTKNFKESNKTKNKITKIISDVKLKCKQCNVDLINTSNYCSQKCNKLHSRKVNRPSKEVLLDQIKSLGFVATGKFYGVSDNSIRKWLKSYD